MNPLLSGGVLAAALTLGQTSEPPTVPPGTLAPSVSSSSVPAPPTLPATPSTAPASQSPQRGPIISFFMREDRPVLSKFSSWFRRDPAETPPSAPTKGLLQRDPILTPTVPTPTPPASSDFPRRLPNPASKATAPTADVAKEMPAPAKGAEPSKELVQTTTPQASAGKAAKSPIRAQFVNKMGRDEKFEWITGQLEWENGSYVLYYATPEIVDKFQGRIVLQPQQVDMKELKRGDLVSVRGQLVQRSTVPGMAPVYRLTSANLIERPKL